MINKKNLKQSFSNFLIKKIFSEVYYQKYYIRNGFVDTNTTFYNFKKNTDIGFSAYKKLYNYSHIFNNKFTFTSFCNKKNLKSKHFVSNFYNTLCSIKNKNFYFFVLKPTKKGFLSYFSGMTGLTPLKTMLFFLRQPLFPSKSRYFFTLVFFLQRMNKFLNCVRFPLQSIKIKIIRFHKKRNFSASKKKKKIRRFFFNVIFSFKKQFLKQI